MDNTYPYFASLRYVLTKLLGGGTWVQLVVFSGKKKHTELHRYSGYAEEIAEYLGAYMDRAVVDLHPEEANLYFVTHGRNDVSVCIDAEEID